MNSFIQSVAADKQASWKFRPFVSVTFDEDNNVRDEFSSSMIIIEFLVLNFGIII
jgi:hypothetical protein